MSITDDVLLSFSGCSTLVEIEDLVLRDQGLTSIQVDTERQVVPPVLPRPSQLLRVCSDVRDFKQHRWPTIHCRMSIWPVSCLALPS